MHQIIVNGLVVDVVRKDIKHLHVAVYPPNGRIRVAAPLRIDDDAVRLAVIERLAWITRHQKQFEDQDRQTPREYVSGESHYVAGDRYLLDVIYRAGPPQVTIRNKTRLELAVRPGSDHAQREKVMLTWYRRCLRDLISPLVAKWSAKLEVQPAMWGIKQMKTKWGSCSVEARRIWLNLELAKKPERCVEYIVVHELVHLLERNHTERFKALMSQHLSRWQDLRADLNHAPLAHETWTY